MLVKLGLKSSSLSLFEAEAKENGFYYVWRFSIEKHLKTLEEGGSVRFICLAIARLEKNLLALSSLNQKVLYYTARN